MDNLTIFINRLKKIGIEIELLSNIPWLYITHINDKKVTEKYQSNWGYVLGYRNNGFEFENLTEIFNLIRKYIKNK